jgi:PAS domain S-box-containing protein
MIGRRALCSLVVAWLGAAALAVRVPIRAETVQPAGAAPHAVVFLGSAESPPFLFRDADGRVRGLIADLMHALGREAGFAVRFEIVPRAERLAAFRRGVGDVIVAQPNSPAAQGTVTLVPLWSGGEVAFFRTAPAERPAGLADLRGETVAVQDGSSQHASLLDLPPETRPPVVPVATVSEAFQRLRAGTVTAVLAHPLAARSTPEYDAAPAFVEVELRPMPYALVARAGREDLQPLFAAAYLRLQETGELASLQRRVLLGDGAGSGLGWRYLLAALGVGGAALLMMIVWSRSLRREVLRRTRELQEAGERQAMQAHVLSQVTDAVVITDNDTRVTSWNGGAEALFGRPASDAVGQPVGALIANRLAGARGGDLHDAIASHEQWRGDAEIIRPSGDTLYIEATVRPVTDMRGALSGMLVVARDVDARRRAEREAEVRARQQAAVASLGQRALAGIDFPLLLDQAMSLARGTLQVSAAAVFELVDAGRTLQLRAGDGWDHAGAHQAALPVDRSRYPACVLSADGARAAIGQGQETRLPVDAFHMKEGIISGGAAVIPARSGPYGVFLVGDRRERRLSRDDMHFVQALASVIGAAYERSVIDADLRAELALHDATLEAAADGILVTDADGTVRRYNGRLLEMWAFPSEVVSSRDGERWLEWAFGLCADPDPRLADFRAVSQSDAAHSAVMVLKDGRIIERHSRPQVVDGTVAGRVWCYRDVTERVRADEERRRLEAQMQHVQKLESLGVLAGGIAHDFNNLLVGMLGHAGLALMELAPDDPARERVEQIQTTAQRAAELTNQMLAYSGKGRFVLQSSDLSEIVGEMTHLLRTAVARNAEIVLDLTPDLPAFDGDPAQIRQVIMNLITNASDAIGTAPGTITVHTGRMAVTREYVSDAWIGADLPEGEYVFAEVHDTGCGMDAATLARIFDPFFTTKFTGRGLGLAAVLGIVRGHHGAIKIASEPGGGTTFRVLLPATSAPPVQVALPPKPAPVNASGSRVLVVDDEAGVRTIASASLKRSGFEVVTANDGVEAVDLLTTDRQFHAVLLDMTMPRMNGVETFRRIKELQPDLPVVLTSGYSAQEAIDRFEGGGIAGFIQKPFMPAALVQAILDAIGQQRRKQVA